MSDHLIWKASPFGIHNLIFPDHQGIFQPAPFHHSPFYKREDFFIEGKGPTRRDFLSKMSRIHLDRVVLRAKQGGLGIMQRITDTKLIRWKGNEMNLPF